MPQKKSAVRPAYVNPVALDDAGRQLVASARRLLDYERYLDGLEHLKMRRNVLPPAVERSMGRSIQANLDDAETLCHQVVELMSELDDLGALETLFSSLDQHIETGGVPKLITQMSGTLEEWLQQRGMPSSTLRWAVQCADWDNLSARAEDGAIVVSRADRTIGVISAKPGAWDAASFVAGAGGLPPSTARVGDDEGPIRLSVSELVDLAARELLTFYRWRARRTALDGVQVLPSGIWWVVVILVIAIILVVTGAALMILCAIGSITNAGLCAIAPWLLILGFIGLAIAGGGYTESTPPTDDPDYDYGTEPDPFG